MAIRYPKYDPDDDIPRVDDGDPEEISLPPKHVIDAGIAKFTEMARLHWPSRESGFKLTSFDFRNETQIRMTLGLVYMAMLEAANKD